MRILPCNSMLPFDRLTWDFAVSSALPGPWLRVDDGKIVSRAEWSNLNQARKTFLLLSASPCGCHQLSSFEIVARCNFIGECSSEMLSSILGRHLSQVLTALPIDTRIESPINAHSLLVKLKIEN